MAILKNRWAILALLFFARASMAMQFQSVPPIAPHLIAEWGIGYTEVGLLIGLYMVAGIALALPGGLLSQRFGDKAVVLLGMAMMTAGTALFAGAPSYSAAFVGRFWAAWAWCCSTYSSQRSSTTGLPGGESSRPWGFS